MRYLAFQVPETILFAVALILARRWTDLPSWAFWGLIIAWVAKDLCLFPFLWKFFEPPEDRNPMVGTCGVAQERLAPSGWVRIGSELWKATVGKGSRPIALGEPVRILEVRGLTLIVEPEEQNSR
ncbi:MAG: NfeD family protein [Deltaproteobacteria bacterium]|nr:NfeD family protein [Deltaproteobacteria bacterium]